MPGIKMNAVKERLYRLGWIDLTTGHPYQRLMAATGRRVEEIYQVLSGIRVNAGLQDEIAALVGVNVIELFGDMAWPRQATRAFQRRLDDLEASERKALRARLARGGAVAEAREHRRHGEIETKEAG